MNALKQSSFLARFRAPIKRKPRKGLSALWVVWGVLLNIFPIPSIVVNILIINDFDIGLYRLNRI
jgi:hypothetical protein